VQARHTDRRQRGVGRRAAMQAASRCKWRGPDSGGCRKEWPSDVVADTTHRHVRVWVLVRGGRGLDMRRSHADGCT
jgi:hypothetical protein